MLVAFPRIQHAPPPILLDPDTLLPLLRKLAVQLAHLIIRNQFSAALCNAIFALNDFDKIALGLSGPNGLHDFTM